MPLFTDQMNRTILLEQQPKRIVSLVPSQTELLFDLGLEDEVVGITRFCTHPLAWHRSKTRIGGTKQLNLGKIQSLTPDLIIGNKEENDRTQMEALMQSFPVWMSDINSLDTAFEMISEIGNLTGKTEKARELVYSIREGFSHLTLPLISRRAAYFIWREPWMVAGNGTFINEMMMCCGWINAFQEVRYPIISPEALKMASPDIILLSSEPYPFREKHFEEFRDCCPNATIQLVDGELFSWYGSRLLHAPSYFNKLLSAE